VAVDRGARDLEQIGDALDGVVPGVVELLGVLGLVGGQCCVGGGAVAQHLGEVGEHVRSSWMTDSSSSVASSSLAIVWTLTKRQRFLLALYDDAEGGAQWGV